MNILLLMLSQIVEEKVTETEYKIYQSSKEYMNPRIGQTESRYTKLLKILH